MTHDLTDAQLIEQTAEYLKALPHRSGVEKYGPTFECRYRSPDEAAPACAAGLWIKDEFYNEMLEKKSIYNYKVSEALISSGIKQSQFAILDAFQDFHDTASNWGTEGLSHKGKIRLKRLLENLKRPVN